MNTGLPDPHDERRLRVMNAVFYACLRALEASAAGLKVDGEDAPVERPQRPDPKEWR